MNHSTTPGVSVIMPTYNQGAFVSRAIASLKKQTFRNWELIIINDGCTDYTEELLQDQLKDKKVLYLVNENNEGLGACLNKGIQNSNYDLIAYLPSDDIYYTDHLQNLFGVLTGNEEAILAYAGVKYDYRDTPTGSVFEISTGKIENETLQLIQVMHRKTCDKWMERQELVTDDLDRMFWSKLSAKGTFQSSGSVTCEWIDHPEQRHKIIREDCSGGLNLYKQYYNIKEPIVFQSSVGNYINEIIEFARFRGTQVQANDSLKILLVGELAYNPERIVALEEHGHQLYGLWMNGPHCYNTVGPLPFGNVIDIPLDNWVEAVAKIKPDIIYALLNHQAVSFAHYIMLTNPGIPFVWHFKEGPFFCRSLGSWKELMELYVNSDGQIYISPEAKEWYGQFISEVEGYAYILDGDLPKKEWFMGNTTPLLSDTDQALHTVIPGRPFGLNPHHVQLMADQNIHLHLYGDMQQIFWKGWINACNQLAPGYLHIHPNCTPENWVSEFSKYDAGWLHYFNSENFGEYMKATWPDLNYPARMSTLAAAGLPMIQKDNAGHIVATQSLIKELNMGIFFNSFDELGDHLRNKKKMAEIRENVWNNRMYFSFDYHVDDLVTFFRKVIAKKKNETKATADREAAEVSNDTFKEVV